MATITTSPPPAIFPGVTLHNVDWAEYCKLRDDPAHDHLRMTYLDGELTIMSPGLRHDFDARQLLFIATSVLRAWRIEFIAVGTTTLRREARGLNPGAGKEPDEGFYLRDDVARVKHNQTLDLSVDPPPTLAIEVDHWSGSQTALAAYARIGVPEVWLYKVVDQTLWFGQLVDGSYQAIDRSLGIPRLTPTLVLQALEAQAESPQNIDWLDWLDAWARALPEPPAA